MNNNDPFEMPDDEILSPELAAFEAQLRSLKPIAVEMAAGNAVSVANGVTGKSGVYSRSIRSLRFAPFPAAILFPVAILVLALATVLTLYWPGRVNNPSNAPQYIPGNSHQIAEIKTPEPTHIEDQQLTNSPTVTFHGGLTMRKQLVMLLDEMQPQGITSIEPKQPDYPVMVIPVCQDTRPLSPEAKQAFQQRLQGHDPEMGFALWN